jgi:hypothetical protein
MTAQCWEDARVPAHVGALVASVFPSVVDRRAIKPLAYARGSVSGPYRAVTVRERMRKYL